MTTQTLTDIFSTVRRNTAAKVILGSLLIALCAQIRIPLPFSPVPLTLQTLGVIAAGAMLGSKKGGLSALTYLAQVLAGFPVLAGASSNPLAIVGPTGGYLVGFVLLAYAAGWCFENKHRLGKVVTGACLAAACACQLALGTLWLGVIVGMDHALALGFTPFIPGELLKIMIVMAFIARNESRNS
jgi:biotin transport system substrate-specific component